MTRVYYSGGRGTRSASSAAPDLRFVRAIAGLWIVGLSWLAACGGDGDKGSSQPEAAREDAGSPQKSEQSSPGAAGDGSPQAGIKVDEASCDTLKCEAPAECRLRDGKPVCTCPEGYDDPKGDGSECKDRDECASETRVCDKHARCKNTAGSYECSCNGPAYEGDGKSCKCAKGYTDKDGLCLAENASACGDNLDCVNGHCVGGVCCESACDKPDGECKTSDGATCEDGKTCRYATAKDGAACDDGDACVEGSTCQAGKCQAGTRPVSCDDQNPCTADSCDKGVGCKNQSIEGSCDDGDRCTSADVCKAGACVGAPLDCSGVRDACNDGACDPSDGACKKRPAREGATCDDGSTCTTGDRCAAGSCQGPESACGPNATACAPGTPNSCTCKPEYNAAGGLCVPQNDECAAASPCSPNGTCFDPSNNAGDATCKCNTGYEGDGKTCTLKEPCKDNPCGEGRGTCTPGSAGTYTCSCGAGFKAIGGTCTCDLTGTFAGRVAFDVSWRNISGFEDGAATTYNWLLERNQVAADGSIEAEVILCGESGVDLCGNTLGNEAYAQWLPRNYYDSGVTSAKLAYRIERALPGAQFETPEYALLAGISLTDPLGAWPSNRKQVQGGPDFGGTATNGARWVDMDGDSVIGVTTYAVGPEGMAAEGDGPRPLSGFGTTSPDCPRGNASARRYTYAYPPAADGLIVRRVKRFSTASRMIAAMRGKLDSCDAFSGDIIGPNNGIARTDGVIGSCVRVNGDGESACSAQILDFVSGASATQSTNSSKFTFKRVADNITCAQVRALSF